MGLTSGAGKVTVLTYLGKLRGRAVAVVSCAVIAAGLVAAGGASAVAASAGTSIGSAAVLATSATGSLGSTAQDDWWVIYPAASGGTVQLEVSDTTSASAPCTDLSFAIDGPDGGNAQLASAALGAAGSKDESVAQPGAGFYYVEVDPYNCSSVTQPITYSLQVVSGGGGKVPAVTAGTTAAGSSIGHVGAALAGATVYRGTVITTSNQYWYQLYKPSSAGTGTVRIADTTVYESAPCSDVSVTLTDSDGNALDDSALGGNTAVSYSVTNPGLYYVEISAYNCDGSDGATYSVEPNPPSVFARAPAVKAGKTAAGGSIGKVGAALAGDSVYSGTVVTTSNEYWYQLYKPSSKGAGTVRIADTSVYGGSACSDLAVTLTDSDGSTLNSNALGDDTAVTYQVLNAGLYYVEISAYNCDGSDGATYSVEPGPASAFASAPAFTVGKTAGGGSMKRAGGPLAGDTVYAGTIATTSNEYWYKLDKPSGKGAATVRLADTTVYGGSATCSDIGLSLEDSHGTVLDSDALGEDTAVSYTVTNPGIYYVEITAYNCSGSDGATYTIEPNPASAWARTPAITKISPAKGPASGHTLVKIYGTWLAGASSVLFGTAKGTKIHVLSATELTVVSPAHARGTVDVTVTTGAGRSATGKHSHYTFR
jgi:IPT/TIG domain